MADDLVIDAEQIVLGSMMLDPQVIIPVCEILDTGQDMMRPAHQVLFDVITTQYGNGDPADPVAVAAALGADLQVCGGAPYLHTLIAAVPVASNAPWYARIVKDAAVRRRVERAGLTLTGMTEADDPWEILARARALLDTAGTRSDDTLEVLDIRSFTETELPYGDPVIPGLLHEQERVVVVAGEGAGKTEAALQAAVMTAAGLHVFTGAFIPPATTLIIDLENPSASVQRRLRRLLAVAETVPGWDPRRCHIWSRPGGIDLRSPADQRQVTAVIRKVDPKLIVAGPVYKMSIDRGERAEQLHSAVTAYWDQIREKHGSALWFEAHAPMGTMGARDLRPIGSGVWLRWPEFGISLRPSDEGMDAPGTVKVGTFRGHREDRVWPWKLIRSRPWSWAGVYPAGTYRSDEWQG